MLTVTTSFVDGQLSIASDWDDNLVLSVDQGYVKVNGLDPIEGVVAAADVTGLSIRGGLLSKLIDASGTNGHLAISGVSVTMPRISEYVADLYEDTPLESQLMAAFDSGLLTEEDVARVTMGYVDADLLDRLAQVGVSQDLIDKGLEALEFFHPEFENPLDDFHAGQARQMLAATSENDDPVVYGTTGNDILNGGEGNQTFYGGQGSDQIDGGEGNDVIYGGSGNDFLDGGEGKSGFYSGPSDDDTMYGGDGFDTWADGGEGSDVFVQDGPNFDFVYPEPIVTISDPSVVESAASMTFTVTLNNSYSDIVSIPWSTADGSATAPNDYTASSGTLVFAVGETQRGISIPIINDTDNENDETLSVVLGTPTNATIGDGIGVGTIYDNDTPVGSMPSASISTAGNVEEGYGGAAFEITLSQAINKTVRVHYATGGGTAIAGTHYTSVSADVYFAPNETSKIVTVQWNDDDMYEGHLDAPYFFVTLSSPLNATIGTASGYAIIIDDDPLPTLSINDITVTEADPGQPVYATFTVSLSNPIALVVTATVVTGPGTALYLSDYSLPTSANLTIPAGQTSAQFSVAIVTNLVPEPTEYFYATITEANVVVSDSQGIAVIIDNDPLPALSISDVTVNEAVGQAQFFVTRTGAIDVPISVEWYTEEGSAYPMSDYVDSRGVLTFAPGVSSQTIVVPLEDDDVSEAIETFIVTLSSPINAQLLKADGIGTITDDESLPSITVDDVAVFETAAFAAFTLALSQASGQAVTVAYGTSDGTALSVSDYTTTTGVATFQVGETRRVVLVPIANDLAAESDEYFYLALTSPSGATISRPQGTGTIIESSATVPSPDIDTDSDNNGLIENLEDSIEMERPGRYIVLSDDEPSTSELAEVTLNLDTTGVPLGELGQYLIVFDADEGGDLIRVWDSPFKSALVPLGTSWNAATFIPRSVWIEALEPGEVVLSQFVQAPGGAQVRRDQVVLQNVRGDLQAYHPETQFITSTRVPNAIEATVGAGIRRNGDDDDHNQVADREDPLVFSENDLIRTTTRRTGTVAAPNSDYVLRASGPGLSVWTNAIKSGPVPQLGRRLDTGAVVQEWVLPSSHSDFYVEWAEPSVLVPTIDLQFLIRDRRNGQMRLLDTVTFRPFSSTVIGFVGEGSDPNGWFGAQIRDSGVYLMVRQLIEDGWDAHLFNERDDNDVGGAGGYIDAIREVREAVVFRGVEDVGVFGHSHGGGSTYDLSMEQSLAAHLNGRLRYTAYIDAIQQPGWVTAPEIRRPSFTDWHENYYETHSQLVHGASMGALADIDEDVNTWGLPAPVGHTAMDNTIAVQAAIVTGVEFRVDH